VHQEARGYALKKLKHLKPKELSIESHGHSKAVIPEKLSADDISPASVEKYDIQNTTSKLIASFFLQKLLQFLVKLQDAE
jgi:hypothetical protein